MTVGGIVCHVGRLMPLCRESPGPWLLSLLWAVRAASGQAHLSGADSPLTGDLDTVSEEDISRCSFPCLNSWTLTCLAGC